MTSIKIKGQVSFGAGSQKVELLTKKRRTKVIERVSAVGHSDRIQQQIKDKIEFDSLYTSPINRCPCFDSLDVSAFKVRRYGKEGLWDAAFHADRSEIKSYVIKKRIEHKWRGMPDSVCPVTSWCYGTVRLRSGLVSPMVRLIDLDWTVDKIKTSWDIIAFVVDAEVGEMKWEV